MLRFLLSKLPDIDMATNAVTRPARRSHARSLSARQWQEIRQAARLARSEGVEVTRYGFTIRPAPDPNMRARASQPSAPHEDARTTSTPSKKQPSPRDVRRAQDFQARTRTTQRWLPLIRRLLRADRRKIRDDVWTGWMRARMSPRLDAQRKLQNLLWRAWTMPQFGSSLASQDLSLRDIYRRESFCKARERMCARIAKAIQAQEEILMTCPEPDRPSLPTRGVEEAGLKTPASARRGKQARAGRGGRGTGPGR